MERGKKRFYTTKSKRGRPGESDEHKNVILVRVSVCPIFSSPSKELKKRKKKFLCAVNFLWGAAYVAKRVWEEKWNTSLNWFHDGCRQGWSTVFCLGTARANSKSTTVKSVRQFQDDGKGIRLCRNLPRQRRLTGSVVILRVENTCDARVRLLSIAQLSRQEKLLFRFLILIGCRDMSFSLIRTAPFVLGER